MKRALARRPALYANARRAYDLSRWAARRPHEPDFEFYAQAPAPPRRIFLDVGANTGISALCFRMYDKRTPILSIEANPTLRGDLEVVRRLIRGFDYRIAAASDKSGELTLHIPCYRGTPLSGEASLERREANDVWWLRQNVGEVQPGDFSVIERRVQALPLDELRVAPAHVKIDVEGAEAAALRGMRNTIEKHRPTILLERSEGFAEVRDWLHELAGYRAMRWLRETRRLVPLGQFDAPQNVFFVAW